MRVDGDRLRADLETLGGFGRNADGGVDRASYSPADREARAWLAERSRQAGLDYREDAIGNAFIRLDGPDAPPVWTGSHIDAVPNGGAFDGALGVIAGLECVRRLAEEGVALARPVEVVAFADEEGGYRSFLGSSAVALGLTIDDLAVARGRDGRPLVEALEAAGYDPARVGEARLPPGAVEAFVELHIEQGPTLEQEGLAIGVVTGIVGVGRGWLRFEGRADHAGTTPMPARHDALRAAAACVARLPEVLERAGAPEGVVTCGQLEAAPGAANVVPAAATVHLDFRAHERATVEAIEAAIVALAEGCAAAGGVSVAYTRESLSDPVPLDAGLQDRIEDAAAALGLASRRLPSGAGHDSQIIAGITRAGMLFVPSRDGRSHSPAEHTGWADCEAGANVLLRVLHDLATAR
jgi:beta-ureidopropionase / N-carbamoyl-L-amino-acid hydrolase